MVHVMNFALYIVDSSLENESKKLANEHRTEYLRKREKNKAKKEARARQREELADAYACGEDPALDAALEETDDTDAESDIEDKLGFHMSEKVKQYTVK